MMIFYIGVNNYILLLHWGNFILTTHSDSLTKFVPAKHTKNINSSLGNNFNF